MTIRESLPRRWLRGMRGRILSTFLVVASIALVVALVACAFGLERILVTTATDGARTEAQQVVRALNRTSDPQTALRQASTSAQVVQILDDGGRLRAGTQRDVGRPISSPSAGTRRLAIELGGDRDHYVVVTQRAVDGAGRTWWVASAAPVEQDDTIVRATLVLLAITALVLLCAAGWGIHRVVGRALRPVDRIRADVERIETSRSAVRVDVPQTGDEVERLAVTMNRMLDRLDAADARQRAFVSDASHELRSPLTTIRLLTETDPDASETSRLVHREALRMQGLVDDMLTLAKADDGALAPVLADVDLDDLADAEVRRVRVLGDGGTGVGDDAGRAVEISSTIEPVRVIGDAARLQQVLRNLTDNAVRHASSRVRVSTRLEQAGDGTVSGRSAEATAPRTSVSREAPVGVVVVENDGPPIPAAQRDAVFGRFVRLDEARDRDSGGSGLGLAISRAIAEAHGGTLTADESADGWCRFTLRVPVRE